MARWWIMKYQLNRLCRVVFLSVFLWTPLQSSHNSSRYFPFLERIQNASEHQYSHVDLSLFYTTAPTAIRRGGGTTGIQELWGKYDLKDVISSLQAVQGSLLTPIEDVTGTTDLVGKSLRFDVNNKVRSHGLTLQYEQKISSHGLFVGAWLPVMRVLVSSRYIFNRKASSDEIANSTLSAQLQQAQDLQIDKIRRNVHEELGFKNNYWDKTGFGDLDLYLKWSHYLDHKLLMKSITVSATGGITLPTGALSDKNNPISVSFMGNGHCGLYLDIMPEFELKQDWKVGILFGATYQFKNSRTLRLSVDAEPTVFSALTGRVEINPGGTLKLSPFLTIENIGDGWHFQVRYTYLRHAKDTWRDIRFDKTIQSYLQKDFNTIKEKEELSLWRSHYVSFQLLYDSVSAMKKYCMKPAFYLTYDMPLNGNGMAQTHQLSLGAKLHF